MKFVRIGWAVRRSISGIDFDLERCSSKWEDPSYFLQNRFQICPISQWHCSFEDNNSSVDEAVYTLS